MFPLAAPRHYRMLTVLLVFVPILSQTVGQPEPSSMPTPVWLKSDTRGDQAFYDLILPAGERLVLRLGRDLDTSTTRRGERCQLVTVHEIFLGLAPQLSIPAGLNIGATVVKIRQRKRPFRGPQIELRTDSLELPTGETLPFRTTVLRRLGKISRRGRDLIMPKGVLLEVALLDDTAIPLTNGLHIPWQPSQAAAFAGPSDDSSAVFSNDLAQPISSSPPNTSATLANNSRNDSFRMRLEVDRILVTAVVRDRKGRVVEGLEKRDFVIHEDGAAQVIREFANDLRPLALALVVDGSGSIEPFREELRDAARETLACLGPEDQVCLFVFSEEVARISDLTRDLERTAAMIAQINPDGRTNIYDAVLDASYHLQRSAPDLRHAIVMISDNWATQLGRAGEGGAIRMALQTDTVVYSLKLPASSKPPSLTVLAESVWMGDDELVRRITDATGGEILELEKAGTLSKALTSILDTLKRRYVMSYRSPHETGGGFRTIEVSLAPRFGRADKDYRVHARRGYYAPLAKEEVED